MGRLYCFDGDAESSDGDHDGECDAMDDYVWCGPLRILRPLRHGGEDHGGGGLGAVQQWDAAAKSWTLITDFIDADMELIAPMIKEDSEAFAKENNLSMRCG